MTSNYAIGSKGYVAGREVLPTREFGGGSYSGGAARNYSGSAVSQRRYDHAAEQIKQMYAAREALANRSYTKQPGGGGGIGGGRGAVIRI